MGFKTGDMVDSSQALIIVRLTASSGHMKVTGLSDDQAEAAWVYLCADARNDDFVDHASDLGTDDRSKLAEFCAIAKSMTGHWPMVSL